MMTRRTCCSASARLLVLGLALAALASAARAADFPLAVENRQSGISLSISGTNGIDWALERTYHDLSIGDEVLYVKSSVTMSLAHNARNSLTRDCALPHVLGVAGPDGVPDSGDEGDIYWKVDRDLQTHRYSTLSGALPSYCVKYTGPFGLTGLTYDGSLPVLGTVGDNGGAWGTQPMNTTLRFAYGQNDSFGNEWHTLTYWDDDEPLLKAAGQSSGREGASDGHCVFLCVNPLTPVIQLHAPEGEQFYTTPVKTYHVPKIWPQTTHLTGGVKIHLVNLTNAEPVEYRVGDGSWQTYDGTALTASDLFTTDDVPAVLEARCGAAGVVYRRTFVVNPSVPAAAEQHGFLLWADGTERQQVVQKVHAIQPFKKSYETFRGSWYQGTGATFDDTRGSWRSGAGMASTSLANAFVVAVEGPAGAIAEARLAKTRLLRMARLQPVGFEYNVSFATPAKDYLNELGQTIQQFADAGVAYDLLAAHFRSTDHAEGLTPIEELCVREGLAKIAKSILQVRANWSATSGGGDTHWSHGYELAFGLMAMAMPTYKSPCYGVSGGDRTTLNDLADGDGKYWNPFPDQAVTWYQCTTDPAIDTPGHPNVRYPFRAEFLTTDDGWWTGPNDLQGDGDRYFTGPNGTRLVDVKYGGMANAECRVELVEMHGYESPFVTRLIVFDHARRLRGYDDRAVCVTSYIRRLLMNGYVPLSWDAGTKTYTAGEQRIEPFVYAFNDRYEFASLPEPGALVGQFLHDLNVYYGYEAGSLDPDDRTRLEQTRKVFYGAYALGMCVDPSQLAPHQAEPNHAPILKPQFKHVVHPGEQVRKDVIAIDPDGDDLTITVSGLPAGATYDPAARLLTWTPGAGDAGVHTVTVSASDGTETTSLPFAMIVKADAPAGPIPAGPSNVTAALAPDGRSVELNWTAPAGVSVAAYVIYRDGAMWATTPAGVTTYTDDVLIVPGSNTRYHVALYNAAGSEASAAGASPGMIHVRTAAQLERCEVLADHGAAGSLALVLADGGVECRQGGIGRVRLTFDSPLDPATVGPGAVTIVGHATGDVSARIESIALEPGDESLLVVLSLPLVEDDRFTIAVADTVRDAGGMAIDGGAITLGVLTGDVDASGQVTAADVVAVRSAAGQAASAATARLDVNRSGQVTGDDLQMVQKRVGAALP